MLFDFHGELDLLSHPKVGASYEGYAIEEVLKATRPDAAYFWATHQGAELDLLLMKGGRRFGFEVKYQDAPRLTPSMRSALSDLGLERLTVLYPGAEAYQLEHRVRVTPLAELTRQRADQTRRTHGRARSKRSRPARRRA